MAPALRRIFEALGIAVESVLDQHGFVRLRACRAEEECTVDLVPTSICGQSTSRPSGR